MADKADVLLIGPKKLIVDGLKARVHICMSCRDASDPEALSPRSAPRRARRRRHRRARRAHDGA